MAIDATTTSLLLRQFVEYGNSELFEEIDHRYRPIVQSLARNAGFTSEEAEDVAQETLLRVARNAKRFDSDRSKLKTWLLAIAKRCLVDAHRARAKRQGWRGHSVVDQVASDQKVDTWWERECQAEIFRRALAELRERSRLDERTLTAFERFALQQEEAGDVARDLEMSVDQVYVAKSRCIVKLRPIVSRLKQIYELE